MGFAQLPVLRLEFYLLDLEIVQQPFTLECHMTGRRAFLKAFDALDQLGLGQVLVFFHACLSAIVGGINCV